MAESSHTITVPAPRVALIRTSRRITLSLWPTIVAGVWLGLVGATALFSHFTGRGVTLCLFKRLTGHPCAGCGSTRAVQAMAHGHVAEAITLNPLISVALIVVAAWLVLRLGFGRRLQMRLSQTARRAAWAALVVAFVSNWIYLWYCGR